jgi:hypothetical protein
LPDFIIIALFNCYKCFFFSYLAQNALSSFPQK